MVKYICTNCGYAYEGETPPTFCPQCKAPEFKFKAMVQDRTSLPDEHRVGVVEGINPEIIESLQDEFRQESVKGGMYIAMSRQADREGYPEIADAYKKIAMESAEHSGRLAELLGGILFADTKKNLELRADAEFKDSERKKKIANDAKRLNLDEIHDVMHEMCKDKARHYNVFKGLRDRMFE